MRILVLGGAGYIGSHFCRLAADAGFEVRIFDDFSAGHDWAVSDFDAVSGNILDTNLLTEALASVDAVCHFAAKIVVSESVTNPGIYMENNVGGTQSVLIAMSRARVRALVFSSTAAVYGMPEEGLNVITEDCVPQPINPYGESKLQAEQLIQSWAEVGNGVAMCFRYFNAAGALPEFGIGEAHDPETHLIPNILRALITGSGDSFELYGDDYPTEDGTCVRDYVHVADIADAHLLGLEYLGEAATDPFTICNLGSGLGYSNLEVIRACEAVHGAHLDYQIKPRRAGDSARLVASNNRARDLLGWTPRRSDIETIVSGAYEWHLQHG